MAIAKKKVSKKKVAKKTTKKTTKKVASKKVTPKKVAPKKVEPKKDIAPKADKVDPEEYVSNIMGSLELTAVGVKQAVEALIQHVSKCGDVLPESGGIMALTNHLKDVLPVGETKSLDIVHDTLAEFKKKDALIKTGIANAQARLEATNDWKALQGLKNMKVISGCYSKVFMNILDANVVHYQGEYKNSIETPLGHVFRYRANPSLKVNAKEIEKLPNEFKTATLTLSNIEDVERLQKLLEGAGIEAELNYSVSSKQKASLKAHIVAQDKQHEEFMKATPEERELEGLEDVKEEDKIEGAEATWNAGVDGDFGKLKF